VTQSRLAVTGTPGTGKTTVTEHIDTPVIHLNDVIHESEAKFTTGRDEERDSVVVDLEAVSTWLGDRNGIIESHLAHYFDADGVVVLRCHPEELESRLRESMNQQHQYRKTSRAKHLISFFRKPSTTTAKNMSGR